jgi:ATP-dependent protease ClpP protease subunit
MKKYMLNGEIADFDYHSDLWDFCGPKSLKAFLRDLKAGEKAVIEINSPGGLVISGIEMANAIKNSKAHLIAHVTGIAASMASVVACACDEIRMEEASFMMIHNPWTGSVGDADQLRKDAAFLDQCKKVIMSFYRGKFECDEAKLSELMNAETWYTGAECLENGLKCEVVASDMKAAAKVGSRQFAAMPEGVKALYSFRELDAETRAKIEAAVKAADEGEGAPAETSAEGDGETVQPSEEERQEAATEEPAATETAEPAPAADSWEARFKGASRKINELQESVKAKDSAIVNLNGQLERAREDLANANAKVSELSGKLDEGVKALEAKDRELAEVRDSLTKANEQVKHLEETRSLLTGGVLSLNAEGSEYEAKMAKAKNAEEREKLRALKRSGKIK